MRRLIGTGLIGAVAVALSLGIVIPGVAVLVDAPRWRMGPGLRLRDLAQRSSVTDAAGNLLGHLGSENREFVALDEIPELLQDAVVAVEDKSYLVELWDRPQWGAARRAREP